MIKWILALVIIIAGGWYALQQGWMNKFPPLEMFKTTQTVEQPATTTPQQPQTVGPGMSANNDPFDAALAQDAAAVDAQMQGFASDSAAIDAGINDKPVEQNY